MTVRDLIEVLQAMPKSAQDATVTISCDEHDANEDIHDVRYEAGEVVIEPDHDFASLSDEPDDEP